MAQSAGVARPFRTSHWGVARSFRTSHRGVARLFRLRNVTDQSTGVGKAVWLLPGSRPRSSTVFKAKNTTIINIYLMA